LENLKAEQNLEVLTAEQVNEVLSFANEIKEYMVSGKKDFNIDELSIGFAQGYGSSNYTPEMANTLLKGINLNPLKPTIDKIEKALDAAKDNEFNLIAYCQDSYIKNMLFKRNQDYIAGLPAFRVSVRCPGAKAEDFNSPAFKKDYAKVKEFLTKFDYRSEFAKIFYNMLITETYYGIFREDLSEDKYIFQDFPYEYAKITSRTPWGLSYDINMNYFTNASVDIDMFPKWVKKKYNELFGKDPAKAYRPSASIDYRTGKSCNWVQTSYKDGAWCFKFRHELVANIPYFAAMLPDIVLIPAFRKLQMNQSLASARKIITSQWPLAKDAKSGNVSNALLVDPTMMGKLLGVVAKGLEDAIKIVNLPSEEMRGIEFKNTDKDSYTDFLRITSSLMGGGNVLFNTMKNTVAETNLSLNIDENLVTSIYPQFESFLEYTVNKFVKKYRFKFSLSGTETYTNKSHTMSEAFDSAAKGVVCINKIANSLGMDIFELEDELEMTHGMKLSEKLMSMVNMYTQPSPDSVGRPQKKDEELSESGAVTRSQGGNLEKRQREYE
jgi:hypothetical protein